MSVTSNSWVCLALVAAVCMVTASRVSAAPEATPEARAYIEKYGADFSFDREQEIIALYTRILQQTRHDDSGLAVKIDLRYGSDERNRLDVHYGKGAGPQRQPVVIFFHGGGFVAGDKQLNGAIYSNVARYFARHGLVAINSTYRLAPKSHWPSGREDVAAVVSWAHAHAAEFGGDPNKLFLMGHSAGAAHVASYVFSDQNQAGNGLAGVLLLSGIYTVAPGNPESEAYFGADPRLSAQQSSINHVAASRPLPTLIAFAQYDPLVMQTNALEMTRKLCERDATCPTIKEVMGHNHLSMIFHVDTNDDSMAGDLVAFVKRVSQ